MDNPGRTLTAQRLHDAGDLLFTLAKGFHEVTQGGDAALEQDALIATAYCLQVKSYVTELAAHLSEGWDFHAALREIADLGIDAEARAKLEALRQEGYPAWDHERYN